MFLLTGVCKVKRFKYPPLQQAFFYNFFKNAAFCCEGVFTYFLIAPKINAKYLKNIGKVENTTLGFVRFNENGEVEYIFVNPIFRKQGLATKLLQLVREKTEKEIILQEPISPLGSKLLKSLNKWK